MTQLAARTGVSDTYPLPSNATAKAALAAMWDVINEISQAAEIDLASAATTNIGGQVSRKLRITGTTGITSLGTTYTGPIVLRFAAALTITHHATTLICPGATNLTVAAGDVVIATPKCTASGTFDGWMIIARPDSKLAALNGSAAVPFSALAVNTAQTTVASATTPDIFAVTTGQLINYTGTATCTGFVAAPRSGMFRILHCADACSFTAGANLLIEGIPSGTTITLGVDATVVVYSVGSSFKMTYSLSGTFTATVTTAYFTEQATGTAYYKVENGVVTLRLPNLSGTSNSIYFVVKTLPACLTSAGLRYIPGVIATDNGVVGIANFAINGVDNLSVFYGAGAGDFTASGSKSLPPQCITYSLG